MNTKHTALAVLLAISLGGNMAASARSHKTTETSASKTEQTVSTTDTGSSKTRTEHKRKTRERKSKAEAAQPESAQAESESAASKTETKKSNPLFRLFAPLETKNKTETEKTTTSKKMEDQGSHEGKVYVHGYTTKTGKHVEGYWRKRPGQG
ncbi:MAG TPA: hypothetical protein V6D22_13185 [Candidatus Obscuribacterales bacterium]